MHLVAFRSKIASFFQNIEHSTVFHDLWVNFFFLFTSAPSSTRVSMSTAVCTVMWRHPAILAPLRIAEGPYLRRIAMRPGISFSASIISFRPNSAKEMSAVMHYWFILGWNEGGYCCYYIDAWKKCRSISRPRDDHNLNNAVGLRVKEFYKRDSITSRDWLTHHFQRDNRVMMIARMMLSNNVDNEAETGVGCREWYSMQKRRVGNYFRIIYSFTFSIRVIMMWN